MQYTIYRIINTKYTNYCLHLYTWYNVDQWNNTIEFGENLIEGLRSNVVWTK